MKKLSLIIAILIMFTITGFAQEAIIATGSNTSLASYGTAMNQYDYLLNPAYAGQFNPQTIFFALDNSLPQLGVDYFTGIRAGWAVNENMGFILNYRTDSYLVNKEVGGADTADDTSDDYQNITLNYTNYDQATGRYATITETVSDNYKLNNIQHELFLHSVFGIGDGMGLAIQALYGIDVYDEHSIAYVNTYSDTAAPTAATLTNKGDMTETVNTLLDDANNTAALDIEFGMSSDSFTTRVAAGVDVSNLRLAGNSYTQTVTVYNAGAGVDDTVRDSETITSNTGQYYDNGAVTVSFGMNTNTPNYLSTITAGIGSQTEIPLDGLTVLVPFDIGFDFPLGDLQTVASTTNVGYEDATAENLETARSVFTTTTDLDMGLDMYARTGAGIVKVFMPAENASVTVVPGLYGSIDIANDTRTRTTTTRTQVDGNGNGSYADAASDTDTTYTQSGWEIQTSRITSEISLELPVGVEWVANDLMTFHAGYNMELTLDLFSISTLETGNGALIYETFTDNLTAANSYVQRLIDGANGGSTPNSSFTTDFGYSGNGEFGASLAVSENFTIDILATGDSFEIDDFTVMGIMTY